jgi:hypothetical protein
MPIDYAAGILVLGICCRGYKSGYQTSKKGCGLAMTHASNLVCLKYVLICKKYSVELLGSLYLAIHPPPTTKSS